MIASVGMVLSWGVWLYLRRERGILVLAIWFPQSLSSFMVLTVNFILQKFSVWHQIRFPGIGDGCFPTQAGCSFQRLRGRPKITLDLFFFIQKKIGLVKIRSVNSGETCMGSRKLLESSENIVGCHCTYVVEGTIVPSWKKERWQRICSSHVCHLA